MQISLQNSADCQDWATRTSEMAKKSPRLLGRRQELFSFHILCRLYKQTKVTLEVMLGKDLEKRVT